MSGSDGLADLGALAHFKWNRLLGRMRVLGASEHAQLTVHLSTQRVLGQHTLDRQLDNTLRVRLLELVKIGCLEITDVASVALVQLVLALVAGHLDLVRIDDDDIVPGVNVRGVGRLVLATQATGDFGRHVTQGLVFGVDQEPLPLNFGGFGADGCFVHGGGDQLCRTIGRMACGLAARERVIAQRSRESRNDASGNITRPTRSPPL